MGALKDLETIAKGWSQKCPACSKTIERGEHPVSPVPNCPHCGWQRGNDNERRQNPRTN